MWNLTEIMRVGRNLMIWRWNRWKLIGKIRWNDWIKQLLMIWYLVRLIYGSLNVLLKFLWRLINLHNWLYDFFRKLLNLNVMY